MDGEDDCVYLKAGIDDVLEVMDILHKEVSALKGELELLHKLVKSMVELSKTDKDDVDNGMFQ
jgi:hypothetical protein